MVDGSEIVAHDWWRPADAIRAHQEGQLPITPPTLVSLHDLQGEDDPSVLLAQLGKRSPPRFFPRVVRGSDQMAFLYEGDAAYESGDLSEQGARHRTLGAQGIFRYVGAS